MLKTVAAAAFFAVPVVALGACSAPEKVATSPGTTPAVWTGSPAPTASPGGGHAAQPQGQAAPSPAQPQGQAAPSPAQPQGQAAPSGDKLTAQLKLADGTTVATADIDFTGGFATVTVQTTTAGKLTRGFHGLHIHSVGKCEPNSMAPSGGVPGDFLSAGAHFQMAGHTSQPASGDLSPLQVRGDGSGKLVTTTDAFAAEDLLAGPKTAIIIHEKADNFANIPPERYQQVNGQPPPDAETMATGDAGKRVACGVIGTG